MFKVEYQVMKYCGDGCCSWNEWEHECFNTIKEAIDFAKSQSYEATIFDMRESRTQFELAHYYDGKRDKE